MRLNVKETGGLISVANVAGGSLFYETAPELMAGRTRVINFDLMGNPLQRTRRKYHRNPVSKTGISKTIVPLAVTAVVIYWLSEK